MAVFTTGSSTLLLRRSRKKLAVVPDVSRKGRDAIASMAHGLPAQNLYRQAGKDLVAELKALPKQIDESRRIVRERLDALKDEVRRPLTEWEAEQERIKAEEAMNACTPKRWK
jgi:hypothetical protein